MNTQSQLDGLFGRQGSSTDEQVLHDYWLNRVRTDSPAQLLDDFRRLFIEGRGFREAQVYSALEKIVKAKNGESRFDYFFNRCCHILINHWQMQPQLQTAIPELIGLFENLAAPRSGYCNTPNRLRYLINNFTHSDHYTRLHRLARVIDAKANSSPSIGSLINRYPYLYNHCLLGEESSYEHQQTVRHIKAQTERRFEVNISRYVTYKVRLAQMARSPELAEDAGRIIRPVKNPTLLNDKELNRALKHFVGTVEGGYTFKTLSQSFLSHTAHTQTFQAFKDDLYEYILGSIDSQYGRGQFNKRLYQLLQNALPECNQQKLSEFLMLRTSSQLLNYLVVESANQPDHYVFIDMIANLGVTQTVGILLKIALMCRKVKPYLEKRFSVLFNHYESFSKEGVPWLVKSLENIQVAFSVHFGKADLTCLNQVKMN